MRLLLAHNSLYFPSHGGGDKSNRLLMEAMAARGHEVEVVARIEDLTAAGEAGFLRELGSRGVTPGTVSGGVVRFERNGVAVHTATATPNLRGYFASRIEAFDPDVIITSTDDPAQLLFEAAAKSTRAHLVYLIRATIATPFGPHSAFPNPHHTDALRQLVDLTLGVSESVSRYARVWGGMDAIHVPISLLEPGVEFPYLGRFESEFVTMVNPCGVKGVDIFAGVARALPHLQFAAVPTWGTSESDWAKLNSLDNLTILKPVDNIDDLLRRTRVMMVPSLWAEARSRMVLEAMARGIPVVASHIGGLPEAKMGVPYLVPIRPITRYRTQIDAQMVPVPEVPPQDVSGWTAAISRLTSDPGHYAEIASQSRVAAMKYVANLTAEPFERKLEEALQRPIKRSKAKAAPSSDARRKALEKLMAQRSPQSRSWIAGIEGTAGKLRLFVFPHAGGGSAAHYRAWREVLPPFVALIGLRPDTARYPGMEELIPELARMMDPYLKQPFAFFGHSMGALIAYELAQHLQSAGKPGPIKLYASAARAPHYRLNHVPPPDPSDEAFLAELRRLEGVPANVLDDPAALGGLLLLLKADASFYRRYRYTPKDPLQTPIMTLGGETDPNITSEQLDGWRSHTQNRFEARRFEGGHFYLDGPAQPEFLKLISEDLALCSVMLTEEV